MLPDGVWLNILMTNALTAKQATYKVSGGPCSGDKLGGPPPPCNSGIIENMMNTIPCSHYYCVGVPNLHLKILNPNSQP